MKLKTFILLLAIGMLLTTGCVKKSLYNKSENNLKMSRSSWQTCKGDLQDCSEKLGVCQNNAAETQEALQALGEVHEQTQSEKQALANDYTTLKALLAKIKKSNEMRQKAMDELLAKFEALIKSGKLSIGVNDGRMVIQLPSNVLFRVGKSRLSKKGREAIKEVAEVLGTIEGRKFQVAGHTDNQRGKSRVNPNWTLSDARARSVLDLLIKTGVDESNLSFAAYAEYSPVADNRTKEGREKNRRIEIVLLPTSDELPLKQLMKIETIEKKIEN